MEPQSSSPCSQQFLSHVNALHSRNPFLHNSHCNINVQLTPPSWGGGRGSVSRRTSVLTTSGHLRTVPSTEYVIQSFLFSCHFGLQTIIAQINLRRSSCEVPCCVPCDFNKIREGSTNFNRTPHYHIPGNSFGHSSVVNMPTDRQTQRT
jgi:hypothetical protein